MLVLLAFVWMMVAVHARRPPEASSTLLKMHRLYTMHPPHDASLYNILRVSPNATVAEITKSFRKRTRELHPDKARHYNSDMSEEERADELEQVREAYEVLKDDATRLPYHRFGLLDTGMAAFLLTGGKMGNAIPSPEQNKLLEWMGYSNPKTTHQQVRALRSLETILYYTLGLNRIPRSRSEILRECTF
jgi:curved DNA-binding protein CbpA